MTSLSAASPSAAPLRNGAALAPTGPQSPGPDSWVSHTIGELSLAQKVGQLFVADVWGRQADEANEANQRKYGVATPAEVVRRYHVGGVIYFNNPSKDNVDNPAQVAKFSNGLQQAALDASPKVPLLISTDQEGGKVTRIGKPATEFPSNMALGATASEQAAKSTATISARELRAMGINYDFAPDADVNSNPLNPVIGSRSFSADPGLASKLVAAQVEGYQRGSGAAESVSASVKHFPGHGDAADDSHTGLPVINRSEAQWRQQDLPPFKAAVAAGVDSVMTAHITVPSLDPSGDPATLSKPIISGLLRGELGYDGVVVTDSLQMEGVRKMHSDAEIPVLALEAGVDQMLMPPNLDVAIQGVLNAIQAGRLTEDRINQSVKRILTMKYNRGITTAAPVDEARVSDRVGTPQHRQQVQKIADSSTTVLRDEPRQLPLQNPGRTLVVGWNRSNYPGYPAEPVAALAKQLGSSATAMSTGASPTKSAIDNAVSKANNSDTVIVLTNDLRTNVAQRDLLNAVLATGKRVIAVAVQEPYDAGYVAAPTWIASYDWREVSMVSLAKVLTGKVAAQGKLPVGIPSGIDPARILFPIGHGLSR